MTRERSCGREGRLPRTAGLFQLFRIVSLKIVQRLSPRRAFFVHMSHDLGHEDTNRLLPPNVRLAHDGLKLEFEI